MIDKTVGFALCGSFCTYAETMEALKQITERFTTVIPILSEASASTDTRFGTAKSRSEDHRIMRNVDR